MLRDNVPVDPDDRPAGRSGDPWQAGGSLTAVTGLIGTITAAYATTRSLMVTLLAAGVSVLIAALLAWRR